MLIVANGPQVVHYLSLGAPRRSYWNILDWLNPVQHELEASPPVAPAYALKKGSAEGHSIILLSKVDCELGIESAGAGGELDPC